MDGLFRDNLAWLILYGVVMLNITLMQVALNAAKSLASPLRNWAVGPDVGSS